MITNLVNTTETEAREAVEKHAHKIYDRFGFVGSSTEKRIIEKLTNPEKSVSKRENRPSIAATEVRNSLWNAYSGGTTSASTTCYIFKELGREDELGFLIEEGHVEGRSDW